MIGFTVDPSTPVGLEVDAPIDIDLFAGPGGWDQGILPLGLRPLGFEWDALACRTARAAGHWRHQGDIAALHPLDIVRGYTTGGGPPTPQRRPSPATAAGRTTGSPSRPSPGTRRGPSAARPRPSSGRSART